MTHIHAIDLALSATYSALERNNSTVSVQTNSRPVKRNPPEEDSDTGARACEAHESTTEPHDGSVESRSIATRTRAAVDSFQLAREALAHSLTHEVLAREPQPDPLIRRDANGTWFQHDGEWHPVGRLPARVREAYLQHETEKERGRKHGR